MKVAEIIKKVAQFKLKRFIAPKPKQEQQDFARDLCAFLPGALEVQARPPSPLPRVLAVVVTLLFVFLVLWAILSQVDIIAVAEGKIIPTDRTKEIHALQLSRVHAIHVQEGQLVSVGDPLLDLDQSLTGADLNKTQTRLAFLEEQVLGYSYLDQKIHRINFFDKKITEAFHADYDNAILIKGFKKEMHFPFWAQQLWYGFENQWQGLQSGIEHKAAEARFHTTKIHKLKKILPIIQERADNHKKLQAQQWVAKDDYLRLKQEKISAEYELQEAKEQRDSVEASLAELKAQQQKLLAETRAQYRQKYLEFKQEHQTTQEEWYKAQSLDNAQRLVAPVSGTVMQLAVTTLGSVVQSAQPLMLIVPKDAPLEAEIFLQNKDVGFVDLGMAATVKIHTFPFTKFGTIDAEVTQISGDAIDQEKQGLLFPVRLKLALDRMAVGQRTVKLKPGMSITAEMKTGKRRVIEFFLAPLLEYQNESVRER